MPHINIVALRLAGARRAAREHPYLIADVTDAAADVLTAAGPPSEWGWLPAAGPRGGRLLAALDRLLAADKSLCDARLRQCRLGGGA